MGIGSLPYKEADMALALIFKYTPQIPSWPQLPRRDIREGMVIQFSENFPSLELVDNDLMFNAKEKERDLEKFYEKIIAGDTDYFRISQQFAQGLHSLHRELLENPEFLKNTEFIKCQITGPFTFAASIKDDSGAALLHDPVFGQVIIKGLVMKALWQIKFFRELGKKIIMFIDEPYLGCFGSAYTPINRQDVVKGLTELTEGIKSENVLVGVHCCGNTDWSMFTQVKTIDIINFDAFGFLDKFVLYASALQDFLKRGGAICWGIVPTQGFTGTETKESLMAKINNGIDVLAKKNVDIGLASRNLLLSPSCGLGTLDPKRSERIFQLLSETSSLIRQTF